MATSEDVRDNGGDNTGPTRPRKAEGADAAQKRAEQALFQANQDLERKTRELEQSEARYRWALKAGRLVHWETDLVAGTRLWREDSKTLFGLAMEGYLGRAGGDDDEFMLAMHPDDRHLAKHFYQLADQQDWFPVEYRIVRPDGTVLWLSGGGQVVARRDDGRAARLVNVVADVTDRKAAESHVRFLMRELTHRAKNLLALVLAIARQTVGNSGSLDEFQERFTQRLQGLAASHDLLVAGDWEGASLAGLVNDQLAPFAEGGTSRLDASGPEVVLTRGATEAIGLALHELGTNAVKYGALSVPTGRVRVSWELDEAGTEPRRLRLNWEERGGPAVTPPTRTGFGRVVFERMVAASLDGEVSADFNQEGLTWRLSIPASNLVADEPPPAFGVDAPAGR